MCWPLIAASIRYDERARQDMIAVLIGPHYQRFAVAVAPSYLDRRGRPEHPRDQLRRNCLRGRFASESMPPWEFERDGESLRIDVTGQLIVVQIGAAADLSVDAANAGAGVIYLLED